MNWVDKEIDRWNELSKDTFGKYKKEYETAIINMFGYMPDAETLEAYLKNNKGVLILLRQAADANYRRNFCTGTKKGTIE